MTEGSSKGFPPINIKALFKEKNPKMARLLPGFVYRYITRIMHIPEVNEIIAKHGDLRGIEFANSTIDHFGVSQKVVGIDNIPKEGRFIFASNHPLGGFDGLLLMSNVYKAKGEVRFLVNDILMQIPQLGDVFVPLNKHGGHSRDVARIIHEYYSSDIQILIFPSGLASRKVKGKLLILNGKNTSFKSLSNTKGMSSLFMLVVGNSAFFYAFANIRKFLGIKWNLGDVFSV